jgi:hypothetical protein
LLKYDHGVSDAERRDWLAKATAALRYMTMTHVTGAQKCPDGKQWGATGKFGAESWQSGMWTGTLASGAWLIWGKLDPGLQEAIERVVAWEDDILSRRDPPTGLSGDTKAEENGWEVPVLVLGELMFPAHAHAGAWHETAVKYMMNTLSTEADVRDTSEVDGRAVNRWVKGANLQPDFTLENHNIFHPSYVGCSSYFMTQAALYYAYAGRPVPQAATHHLADTWRMFQTIILPWGESAYPQGMDWELHSLPFINLFAALGAWQRDSFAAHMEQCSLQYMRSWQNMCDGSLAFPGSRLGITRHAINAEQASYGFLAHKVFGPPIAQMTTKEVAAHEEGVREYPYVGFIVHRTLKKFVSFSWQNKIMGMLIPIGAGHEENPEFTVPIANGLVGSFELVPRGDVKSASTVVEHSWRKTPGSFETAGTLLINGGRLRQTLRVISLGSQSVVYDDQVTAVSDVTVQSERGVPLGIENDDITGVVRVVSGPNGQLKFDWQKPQQPVTLTRSWANVDGKLGIVIVAGNGMAYEQSSAYSRGTSVRSDILYGSYSDRRRQFRAGEEVARRTLIFYLEATPEETAALSKSYRVETKSGRRVLHFKQPDASETEILLSR